ncbi:MAG: hypothetical protein IJ806_02235 [Ruminococcus sp.]|nr:hypothetical protein [Ruminococcus sp.]
MKRLSSTTLACIAGTKFTTEWLACIFIGGAVGAVIFFYALLDLALLIATAQLVQNEQARTERQRAIKEEAIETNRRNTLGG